MGDGKPYGRVSGGTYADDTNEIACYMHSAQSTGCFGSRVRPYRARRQDS